MIMSKQKGVALLWALLLTTVLLIITGTMVGTIIKESQMSINIEDSTQAYANAKTGIDWGQKYIGDNPGATKSVSFDLDDTGISTVGIEITPTTIDSLGVFRGVQRKIHYEITNPGIGTKIIPASNPTDVGSNPSSFDLKYDFWKTASLTPLKLGLTDATSSNYIYMLADNTGFRITAKSGATVSTTPYLAIGNPTSEPYNWQGELKYLNGTSVLLIVKERNSVTGEFTCKGSLSLNVSGLNFGDLSKLSAGGSYTASGGTEGDGEYLSFSGLIIDNIYFKN